MHRGSGGEWGDIHVTCRGSPAAGGMLTGVNEIHERSTKQKFTVDGAYCKACSALSYCLVCSLEPPVAGILIERQCVPKCATQ